MIICLKLTDVGTRYQHYTQLLELWEAAYEILNTMNPEYLNDNQEYQKNALKVGTEFLRKQIEIMADYSYLEVRELVESAGRAVNEE